MKQQEISIFGVDELPKVAQSILQCAEGRKVFAFYAEMGAGKTTLIKEICKQLGSHDNFSSPTYSIVNEYLINDHSNTMRDKIYHLDLYRLKNIEEAIDVGVEDYINGDHYCFIEWADLIESLLPDDVVKIEMKSDGNLRNLSIFRN